MKAAGSQRLSSGDLERRVSKDECSWVLSKCCWGQARLKASGVEIGFGVSTRISSKNARHGQKFKGRARTPKSNTKITTRNRSKGLKTGKLRGGAIQRTTSVEERMINRRECGFSK